MVKLYIPQVGDKLKLTSNWNCKLFKEHRNYSFFKVLNIDTTQNNDVSIDISFPKGTVLKVSRLYVRAPASSFDSITFTVESSPVKTLSKGRFWVKLMDANTLEFEEIVTNMDTIEKLKDLYRYVALKNDYQNSEELTPEQSSAVSKEIFNYFQNKHNNALKFTTNLSVDEFLQTIYWGREYRYLSLVESNEYVIELKEKLNSKFKEIPVSGTILPVLDGWVFFTEYNPIALEINKMLELDGKSDSWYKTQPLGSYLARDKYTIETNKKNLPDVLAYNLIAKLDTSIQFQYQGNTVSITTEAELTKVLKDIRKVKK